MRKFTDRMRSRAVRRVVWQGTAKGRARSAQLAREAATSARIEVTACDPATGKRLFVAGLSGFTAYELLAEPWTF